MFVEVRCVRIPGQVVWCNYELARDLGFSVPDSNLLDARLEGELIASCSVRVAELVAHQEDLPVTTLYADRYGGSGMGGNLGAARGGFLSYGNLFLQGIGRTPLFREMPDQVLNAHGNMHMWHGLYVATLTELCANLFTRTPARILCVIDQGGETVYPDGRTHERAIVVRAGNQLRPAHVATSKLRSDRPQAYVFISITQATGQLVTSPGETGAVPNLRETMRAAISDQALAAAQHARWRLTHGALSASNTQMDGGPLDLAQARTNPRAVPLKPEYDLAAHVIPRGDYGDRANGLYQTYHAVRRSLFADERNRLGGDPLDIRESLDHAYVHRLQIELACATGLKRRVAERLQRDTPEVLRDFSNCLVELSDLKNPQAWLKTTCYDERAAVVDIFGLLAELPATYFSHAAGATKRFIRDGLRPVFLGDHANVTEIRDRVNRLADAFAEAYTRLMQVCELHAEEFWGSLELMRNSVTARAAFVNRPIERLWFDRRFETFQNAATQYRRTRDVGTIRRLIDTTLADSYRDIDALLTQGEQRLMPERGVELQIRTIAGVRYSVCAWDDASRRRQLRVEVQGRLQAGKLVLELDGAPVLPRLAIPWLRYRWSVDGWKNDAVVSSECITEAPERLCLRFQIPITRPFGTLAGALVDAEGRPIMNTPNPAAEYAFASPDIVETQHAIRRTSTSPDAEQKPLRNWVP